MKRTFGCAWLFAVLLVACRTRDPGDRSTSQVKPIDVRPPAGEQVAAHHCNSSGWGCEPIAMDSPFGVERLVKTVPGGRVSLELDAATVAEIGPDAQVLLALDRVLEVRRGSVTVRELGGSDPGRKGVRVRLGGHTAEVDPRFGGDFTVRAKDAEHGTLTVERGRMTVQGVSGETTVLLSGETVDMVSGRAPERVASPLMPLHQSSRSFAETAPRPQVPAAPRGLGTMTARVPGRTDVVSGVVLASHHVQVALRDGYARTEIEEVFRNDTPQVLEGRYVFPLPTDASISRLTLWVGDKPVEGEIVEKKRAATIFRSIVEDTVRPRDPALLEWVAGGDFSLKVFPLPAKGTRKVRIAYDQVLPESGGRVRYVYPLGVGAERATDVEDFALHVQASDARARLDDAEVSGYPAKVRHSGGEIEVDLQLGRLRPVDDFVLTYARQHGDEAELSAFVPSWGESKSTGLELPAIGADGQGYFALRLAADLPRMAAPIAHIRQDRILIVDSSHSQSQDSLAGALRVALGLVRRMDPDERYAVLACDSACSSYPEDGFASPADASSWSALERWAQGRTPAGSSDVAGALVAAIRRLDVGGPQAGWPQATWAGPGETPTSGNGTGSGQVVYIGDGAPSSGELTAETIAARVQSSLGPRHPDFRLLGIGRSVDEISLTSLARLLGATYQPLQTGSALDQRIADVAFGLRNPVIVNPHVDLPAALGEAYPSSLPNLCLGQEVVLAGRLRGSLGGDGAAEVRLTGTLAGQPYSVSRRIMLAGGPSQQNPLVPRLWAQARIAELEAAGDGRAAPTVVDVSKQYHVMSRYTSLLVLENDAMYAEFGIKRTKGGGSLSDLAAPAPAGSGPVSALSPASATSPEPPDLLLAQPAAPARPRPSERSAQGQESYETGASQEDREKKKESSGAVGRAADGQWELATELAAPAMAPAAAEPDSPNSPPPAPTAVSPAARARAAVPPPMSAAKPRFQEADVAPPSAGLDDAAPRASASPPAVPNPFPGEPTTIARGTVAGGVPDIRGELSADSVRRAMGPVWNRFQSCYQGGLLRDPSLRGSLVLVFTIEEQGQVVFPYVASGTVADSGVRTCLAQTMRGVHFPSPRGGSALVRYPMVLSPGGAEANRLPAIAVHAAPAGPTATHLVGNDSWMAQGESELTRLRAALRQSPESRKRFEELIRGLLSHGRFDEALTTAKRFSALDPDSSVAEELLSYSAAAAGDARSAVMAVDAQVETDPRNAKWHARAARAFEAMRDERRACAHWRSLAELQPNVEEFTYESLRCRARLSSDRGRALSEARAFARPGKLMTSLVGMLESGSPGPYDRSVGSAGAFEADVACASDLRCPTVFVLAPNGTVFSPFTPTDARSSNHSVALSTVRDGTYRTVIAGAAERDSSAVVTLRALGTTKRFSLAAAGVGAKERTIAITHVSHPPPPPPLRVAPLVFE